MTNHGNHIMDYGTDSDDWESEQKVQRMAYKYWNFDIMPPMGYLHVVAEYIVKHPKEFKGAGPQ